MLLRLVRQLASAPGFRRLTQFEPLLRVSFAVRGSLVDSPARFAFNELRPGRRVRVYRIRGTDVHVALRHKTPDVLLLDEIFSQREYELPDVVLDRLPPTNAIKVVDLGANIGLFGAFISTVYPRTEIVGIEADPENSAVHERTIAANGRTASWTLISAFAAPTAGSVRFASGGYSLSRESGDRTGIEVRSVDVFEYVVGADLVKIDIEGAEWPILADPRFRELTGAAIVLEYHDRGCPGVDPAGEATQAVAAAGYRPVAGPSKPQFGAGVVWGVAER